MEFKLFNKLNKKQIKQLYSFIKNKNNLYRLGRYIDNDKLKSFLKYANDDYNNQFKNVRNFYVASLLNDKIIGVGLIMPINDITDRLTLSFDDKYLNKEYENDLIDILNELHYKFVKNKSLIAMIPIKDNYYNKIFKRFILKKTIKIKDVDYNIYQLL